MKTSDPEVEFLLTAETEWREQNIDSRQQDKGNYNNRHAVFPRGHVNDLEVRQDIRGSRGLTLAQIHSRTRSMINVAVSKYRKWNGSRFIISA